MKVRYSMWQLASLSLFTHDLALLSCSLWISSSFYMLLIYYLSHLFSSNIEQKHFHVLCQHEWGHCQLCSTLLSFQVDFVCPSSCMNSENCLLPCQTFFILAYECDVNCGGTSVNFLISEDLTFVLALTGACSIASCLLLASMVFMCFLLVSFGTPDNFSGPCYF